jgi:hypothetical protein
MWLEFEGGVISGLLQNPRAGGTVGEVEVERRAIFVDRASRISHYLDTRLRSTIWRLHPTHM